MGGAAMWDAIKPRCRGRCRGNLQPARCGPRDGTPLRPPRERGSPLEEAAHGGAGVVPPVVASGSAHCVGHPCSCSFVRRFPRRGPGAVRHRSPQACRLKVAPIPHPFFPLPLFLRVSPTTRWRTLEVGGGGIPLTPADWSHAMTGTAVATRQAAECQRRTADLNEVIGTVARLLS